MRKRAPGKLKDFTAEDAEERRGKAGLNLCVPLR